MKKVKLLLFIGTCLVYSCAIKRVTSNIGLLKYDNYEDRKEVIPFDLSNYNPHILPVKKGEKIAIDMRSSNSVILGKDDVLFNLICEQDLVTGWYRRKNEPDSVLLYGNDNTREKAKLSRINSIKSLTYRIILLGEFHLSDNFNSLLLQIEMDSRNIKDRRALPNDFLFKKMYVVNVKYREVLSMVELASYYSVENREKAYAILLNNRTFFVTTEGDDRLGVKFRFNAKGKAICIK